MFTGKRKPHTIAYDSNELLCVCITSKAIKIATSYHVPAYKLHPLELLKLHAHSCVRGSEKGIIVLTLLL